MGLCQLKTDSLPSIHCTLLVATLVIALGCDSGPKTGRVTGTVSHNGEKVPEGTVTFYPAQGGRPAIGRIQPDGTYELSTFGSGDGALIGEYKVAIEAKRVIGGAAEPKSLKEELAQAGAVSSAPPSIRWLVPQKYSSAESSDITATVQSGQNEIDFELP